MASPYTSPTLTGYNSSPPADDGSAVASNAVSWAKHIDKIGDPLKLFAQGMDTAVAAAFGKMFGNNVTTLASNTSIDATYQGKVVITSAAVTLSLLATATASTNFTFAVYNGASSNADCTIDPNSTETVNGSTTLVLRPGEWAILTCDGSNWRALNYQKPVNAATQATTSGRTALSFSVPPSVTRITMTISGFSTNGSTDVPWCRIGDAGGVETTGYLGAVMNQTGTVVNHSTDFQLLTGTAAAAVWHGAVHLTRHGKDGLTWAATWTLSRSDSGGVQTGSGVKTLSAEITTVGFGLQGSTDNYDAGSVGVWYE